MNKMMTQCFNHQLAQERAQFSDWPALFNQVCFKYRFYIVSNIRIQYSIFKLNLLVFWAKHGRYTFNYV